MRARLGQAPLCRGAGQSKDWIKVKNRTHPAMTRTPSRREFALLQISLTCFLFAWQGRPSGGLYLIRDSASRALAPGAASRVLSAAGVNGTLLQSTGRFTAGALTGRAGR